MWSSISQKTLSRIWNKQGPNIRNLPPWCPHVCPSSGLNMAKCPLFTIIMSHLSVTPLLLYMWLPASQTSWVCQCCSSYRQLLYTFFRFSLEGTPDKHLVVKSAISAEIHSLDTNTKQPEFKTLLQQRGSKLMTPANCRHMPRQAKCEQMHDQMNSWISPSVRE